MAEVNRYIDGEMVRFHDELFEFLRIPSVSARSEHSGDMEKTAAWVADKIRGSRAGSFRHRDTWASRGSGRMERRGP